MSGLGITVAEEQTEMRTVIQNISHYLSYFFSQETRKRQGVFPPQQDVFLYHPVVGTKEVMFVRTAPIFPASAIICKGRSSHMNLSSSLFFSQDVGGHIEACFLLSRVDMVELVISCSIGLS